MGLCVWVCFFGFSFISASSRSVGGGGSVEGTVFIDGKAPIGKIDEDFVCATLDWWPPEKCDYGTCSWGRASLLNLVCLFFIHLCCLVSMRMNIYLLDMS